MIYRWVVKVHRFSDYNTLVGQWTERLTSNQMVKSSNRTGGAYMCGFRWVPRMCGGLTSYLESVESIDRGD